MFTQKQKKTKKATLNKKVYICTDLKSLTKRGFYILTTQIQEKVTKSIINN